MSTYTCDTFTNDKVTLPNGYTLSITTYPASANYSRKEQYSVWVPGEDDPREYTTGAGVLACMAEINSLPSI